MSTPELRVARPTVLVEGEERSALISGLQDLTIRETSEGLASLAVTFGNWGERDGSSDYLYSDRKLLEFGKSIEIKFDDDSVFKGRIMGLEGEYAEALPPTLTVLAEDALQQLRMTRRSRSFEQQSDADVFGLIARDHGLRTELELDGPTWPLLAQLNQSDLAFLRDRARLCGAELWVADNTLYAKARTSRAGATVRLERGKDILEFRVLADLAHQTTSLSVSGWDPQNKERASAEAGDDALGAELDRDSSGASLLREAAGERMQAIVHTLPISSQEAQAQAKAQFRAIARRFVCGEGRAQADARLRVGRAIELVGLGATFDGRYTLVEVCHRFDATLGLRTEFKVERPGIGKRA